MLYIYFLFPLNITIEIWYNLVVQKHGETWYLPFNSGSFMILWYSRKAVWAISNELFSRFVQEWTRRHCVLGRVETCRLFFLVRWIIRTQAKRRNGKRWRVYRNPVWRHIYSWNGKKSLPCLTWSVYQRFSSLLLQSKIRAYVKNGWREYHSCSRQLRTSGRTAKIVYDFYSRPPVWQLRTHIGYSIRIHHWHPLWNFLMKGFLTLVDVLCVLIWIYILREKLSIKLCFLSSLSTTSGTWFSFSILRYLSYLLCKGEVKLFLTKVISSTNSQFLALLARIPCKIKVLYYYFFWKKGNWKYIVCV